MIFKNKKTDLTSIATTLTLLIISTPAQAQTQAYEFTAIGTTNISSYERGWSFTPARPMTISALGMYAHLGTSWNGTPNRFGVRIWNDDTQTLVGSGFVDGSDPLDGYFRFRDSSIPLTPGQTYAISASMQGQTMAYGSNFATANDITIHQNRYTPTPGNFPNNTNTSQGTGYFGPNFKFNLTAAQFNWQNSAGGNFSNTTGNWNYAATPTNIDRAVFNLNSTYEVNFTESIDNARFQIRTDNVTFNLNSNNYHNITNTTSIGLLDGDVANLTIQNGGRLVTNSTIIANYAGSNGTATITGPDTNWIQTNATVIGYDGIGTLNIENQADIASNGDTHIASGPASNGTVNVNNATWQIAGNFILGRFGQAELNINNNAVVNNNGTTNNLALFNNSQAAVTINNARWNVATSLSVGNSVGTSTANITLETNATLRVLGDLTLWENTTLDVQENANLNVLGTFTLDGGHYQFTQSTFQQFADIVAVSGFMAGQIQTTGINDVTSFAIPYAPEVNVSQVQLDNTGIIHGSANLQFSLNNQTTGQVRTTTGQWISFAQPSQNSGQIKNTGGTIEFQTLTNNASGTISGRGIFELGNTTNNGTFAFSAGITDIHGNITNNATIITSGNATTTFWNNLTHNGTEIRTSANSSTVFFGNVRGAGAFTGTGSVFFEGTYTPGNSPAAIIIAPNTTFQENSTLVIEIAGTQQGTEYDHLQINDDLTLLGELDVTFLDEFEQELTFDMSFDIMNIDGQLNGRFSNLDQHDSVGIFNGYELFIDYTSGDGNDIALFTLHLGDTNKDRLVNQTDLDNIQNNFGTNSTLGDSNHDGQTNLQDLFTTRNNFGNTPNTTTTIPEPTTLFTILTLAPLIARRKNN